MDDHHYKSSSRPFGWLRQMNREGSRHMAIIDRLSLPLKPGRRSTSKLSRKEFMRHLSSESTQRTLAEAREKWNIWYGDDRAKRGDR